MNPANVFIAPKKTGNTVIGLQNGPGFPGFLRQQMIQVTGRLVQIQHQCVINRHANHLANG